MTAAKRVNVVEAAVCAVAGAPPPANDDARASSAPPWVRLTDTEARRWGFDSKHPALAMRRWIRGRRAEEILRDDGHRLWFRPADMEALVAGLPVPGARPAPDPLDAVVALVTGGKR